MTNSQDQNDRKWAKRIALAALVGATIVGTYTGSRGLIPIVNTKYKDSYGINLSVGTHQINNSSFYGVNLGLVNLSEVGSSLNGLEVGLGNGGSKIINGLQIGLFNTAKSGNLLQIGLLNKILLEDGSERYSIIFNCAFEGRDSK